MLSKQVMLTSAMTLACALGIGIFMQAAGPDRLAYRTAQTAAADADIPVEPEVAELQIEKIGFDLCPRGY